MRVGTLTLFFLLFVNFGSARAETLFCGSSRLTTAIQYLDWHQTNSYYNQMARKAALEESSRIQGVAKVVAFCASLIFLISVSMLAASITYRLIEEQDIALLLAFIYFGFFSTVLYMSREPIQSVTLDFRNRVSAVDLRELPDEIESPSDLHDFVKGLAQEQARVSEAFIEKAAYLPRQSRWWTMGWDDVNLISFQNEVYLASIRKGESSYRAMSEIRKQLEKKCRESGLQI